MNSDSMECSVVSNKWLMYSHVQVLEINVILFNKPLGSFFLKYNIEKAKDSCLRSVFTSFCLYKDHHGKECIGISVLWDTYEDTQKERDSTKLSTEIRDSYKSDRSQLAQYLSLNSIMLVLYYN